MQIDGARNAWARPEKCKWAGEPGHKVPNWGAHYGRKGTINCRDVNYFQDTSKLGVMADERWCRY